MKYKIQGFSVLLLHYLSGEPNVSQAVDIVINWRHDRIGLQQWPSKQHVAHAANADSNLLCTPVLPPTAATV